MAFKEAVESAGLEIPEGMKLRPAHDLRVASATFGIIAGESIPELMERGGWKNYGTTMQPYLKLAGKVNRDQASKLAASRLGAVLAGSPGRRIDRESSPTIESAP